MDLTPARWIWFPSVRTLPNTFVLFRRELSVEKPIVRATGWISADSRYRLTVNGERVQWGPAPCDPRELDVDPIDLTAQLAVGSNVIGAEVLYYGHGDGTWALGKPGFIFRLDVEFADGTSVRIASNESWRCCINRARRPGAPKRWFLRALQEEFDARAYPEGWDKPDYIANDTWLAPMLLDAPSHCPPACGSYSDYLGTTDTDPDRAHLTERAIPNMREFKVSATRLTDSASVAWNRDPLDWFEFRTPGAFELVREPVAVETSMGWELPAASDSRKASVVTFEFAEQIVGFPYFSIHAPAGTIVELVMQESHDPAQTAWLDSHIFSWVRFVCREGWNHFESFDFESLRWLQLHVRNNTASVTIADVGVRRRVFPWQNEPNIHCSDTQLQRLFDACINTLNNSAQETIVDGMGRERQQYSGDGSHQLHAVRYAFGDASISRRFVRTFGQGLALDGYFLDCWPAHDRLARVMQRQVAATSWGPILDHGIGFVFDCWNHYWETGDIDGAAKPYANVVRFAHYLADLVADDGLLPVENLGIPSVWIDHDAYLQQRHKQCAFNLYAAAMFANALAPLATAVEDHETAQFALAMDAKLRGAAVARFWSPDSKIFVNNLPWIGEEGSRRLCDRSLATAISFGQCPDGDIAASVAALADCSPELGISYPCNAGWRYRALCKGGRADVVVDDWRARWTMMPSVLLNNTIQETWHVEPDSMSQWSHCALAPIFVLFMDIAGIQALEPGFAKVSIRPRLGELNDLKLTAYTVRGPIRFSAKREGDGHRIELDLPGACEGWLQRDKEPDVRLEAGANQFFVKSNDRP